VQHPNEVGVVAPLGLYRVHPEGERPGFVVEIRQRAPEHHLGAVGRAREPLLLEGARGVLAQQLVVAHLHGK
jgi:hypothetical protein